MLMHDALHFDVSSIHKDSLVIASSVTKTLASIAKSNPDQWCGMNLLPGFVSMPIKEVTGSPAAIVRFEKWASLIGWKYKVVPDTPGFITLRVLSMIINEAAHTLHEGTASKEDIDTGMMLGTNYPIGPLKWCDKIGVEHIVNTLNLLYQQTGNGRYRTHPSLEQMAIRGETFYNTLIEKAI